MDLAPPSTTEEARRFIGAVIDKYFAPVPDAGFAGGNFKGEVIDVTDQLHDEHDELVQGWHFQVRWLCCAALLASRGAHRRACAHRLCLSYARYEDGDEEHLCWEDFCSYVDEATLERPPPSKRRARHLEAEPAHATTGRTSKRSRQSVDEPVAGAPLDVQASDHFQQLNKRSVESRLVLASSAHAPHPATRCRRACSSALHLRSR